MTDVKYVFDEKEISLIRSALDNYATHINRALKKDDEPGLHRYRRMVLEDVNKLYNRLVSYADIDEILKVANARDFDEGQS